MKKIAQLSPFILVIATACSSQKNFTTKAYKGVPDNAGKTTEWDYDKIRDVREEESKMPPPPDVVIDLGNAASGEKNSQDCHPLSRSQVDRAKLTGCRKLDPKKGFGEDMYCCPNF